MDQNSFSTCTASNGFTPVRRKEETINVGRTEGEQEQEWTTARCHRLLRALTSRVTILTKEISKYSSKSQSRKPLVTKTDSFPLCTTRTPDDDWMHPRKKVKQTYSGRGRGRGNGVQAAYRPGGFHIATSQQALVPGEVAVPTPLLVRARGEERTSQKTPESPLAGKEVINRAKRRRPRLGSVVAARTFGWQLSGTLYQLKNRLDTTRYAAYEGIFTGLDVLIRSTTTEEPEKRSKGARSLFRMALKIVPLYIAEEEDRLVAFEEYTNSRCALTSRDISTEVYDELESLGTSGKHWKHLRLVVRSHGIQVICDAITAGLLETDFCGVLISLLVDVEAFEEADALMAALMHSSEFTKPKAFCSSADCRLAMLINYANHTERFNFFYGQLSSLIENEILPLSWLATEAFGQIWTKLIQHVSSDCLNSTKLFVFLTTALPALASSETLSQGYKSRSTTNAVFAEASKNTFFSLLTTISSIFILSGETRRLDRFGTMKTLGYEKIVPLLRASSIQLSRSTNVTSSQLALLLLSKYLLSARSNSGETSQAERQQILDALQPRRSLLNGSNNVQDMASLISSIARCCGRGALSSGFDHLQELHVILEGLGDDRVDGDLFKTVIVDSAYEFVQQIPDRQHLDYASRLDRRFASRVNSLSLVPEQDDLNETRSGFRWEEGIGEWVTATPAFKCTRLKPALRSTGHNESESATAFRPRRKVARVLTPKLTMRESSESIEVSSSSPNDSLQDVVDESLGTRNNAYEEVVDSQSDNESATGTADFSDEDSGFSGGLAAIVKRAPRSHTNAVRPFRITRKTVHKGENPYSSDSSQTSIGQSFPRVSNRSKASTKVMVVIKHTPEKQRMPKSSHDWQVFDDSDDELGFVSVSSQTSHVMQDVTNGRALRPRRSVEGEKPSKQQKRRVVDLLSDSEDELCI